MRLDDLAKDMAYNGISGSFDPGILGYDSEELEKELHGQINQIIHGNRIPLRLLQARLETAKLAGVEISPYYAKRLRDRTRIIVDSETTRTMTGKRFHDEYIRTGGSKAHRYGERITVFLEPGSLGDYLSKVFALVSGGKAIEMAVLEQNQDPYGFDDYESDDCGFEQMP